MKRLLSIALIINSFCMQAMELSDNSSDDETSRTVTAQHEALGAKKTSLMKATQRPDGWMGVLQELPPFPQRGLIEVLHKKTATNSTTSEACVDISDKFPGCLCALHGDMYVSWNKGKVYVGSFSQEKSDLAQQSYQCPRMPEANCLSPDGRYLLITSHIDPCIYDLANQKCIATLPSLYDEIFCWLGERLLYTNVYRKLHECDFTHEPDVKKELLYVNGSTVKMVAITPTICAIKAIGEGMSLIRRSDSGWNVQETLFPQKFIRCMAGSSKGLLALVYSNELRCVDVRDEKTIIFPVTKTIDASSVIFCNNDTMIAVGGTSDSGSVALYTIDDSHSALSHYATILVKKRLPLDLFYHKPDNRLIARDGIGRCWKLPEFSNLNAHESKEEK